MTLPADVPLVALAVARAVDRRREDLTPRFVGCMVSYMSNEPTHRRSG